MKCGRCGIMMQKGSAHLNEGACLEAALEALEQARACRECGAAVDFPLHPGCMAAHGAKGAAGVAAGLAQQKVVDFLTEKLSGRKKRPADDRNEPPPMRTRSGRERFDPDA